MSPRFGLAVLTVVAALLTAPAAMAQTPVPDPPPRDTGETYRWAAITAGVVGGIVVLNLVTGGAALAPLVAAEAGAVGAAAAGGAAAAARQAACRWAAIVSSAIAGGFIGNALYGSGS